MHVFVLLIKSFNSQRDGILRSIIVRSTHISLFQFPTGWNSTLFVCRRAPNPVVSIPNGMEFYALWVSVARCSLSGFNSQRDGILPQWVLCALCHKLFQFPTGWNSTNSFWHIENLSCFNSQRDGILREMAIPKKYEQSGFNSQRDGILPKLESSK